MAADIDPEGREIAALFGAADFNGARILEIGCGAGRLTRRYASAARLVAAIDTDEDALASARRATPEDLARHVTFLRSGAVPLPFAGGVFEIVVFGWSL